MGFQLLDGVAIWLTAMCICCGASGTDTVMQDELFAKRASNAFDPATIDAIGDKVTDWQIANAHLDDLSYLVNDNSDEDLRDWVHGTLYTGMMSWAGLPGNEEYFNVLRSISEENEWRLGDRLFHADDHLVGQMYLAFYEKEKDKDMISNTMQQFDKILVTEPNVSLEFVVPELACLRRWCWCDALYMAPQTWMQLSLVTGEDKYMAYADKEYWATTEFLLDPDYSLFYRDSRYFTKQDDEGNKIFWSRGNGWVYAGLANILRILTTDHPSYSKYVQLFKDMSETIASLQHDNGFWRVSLLAKETYASPETSGTAFMTYGLAWGMNNGHLDADTYEPTVRKGWSALVSAVGDDGKLGWVQPIGAAPDSVNETDSQLYGVGGFLLAAEQMFLLGI